MVVGSPRPMGDKTNLGSAAYYQMDPVTHEWKQVGSTLQPPQSTIQQLAENPHFSGFGTTVAMAEDLERVVIGAPYTYRGDLVATTGALYTYEFDGNEWKAMTPSPIVGDTNDHYFGASVDISKNGNRLVVGMLDGQQEAGGAITVTGFIKVYDWEANEWKLKHKVGVPVGSVATPPKVSIITDDGKTFAIGEAGTDLSGSDGFIRVFQETSSGSIDQLGADILPSSKEKGIGCTLSGSQGIIAFGSCGDAAYFGVMGYNQSTNRWQQVGDTPLLGSETQVISVAVDGRSGTVAVSFEGLEGAKVEIYKLSQSPPSTPTAPSPSPTSTPTIHQNSVEYNVDDKICVADGATLTSNMYGDGAILYITKDFHCPNPLQGKSMLTISGNITFDGRGHTIQGPTPTEAWSFGISARSGATIENVKLDTFSKGGITVSEGSVTLRNVALTNSFSGLQLVPFAKQITVSNVTISNNVLGIVTIGDSQYNHKYAQIILEAPLVSCQNTQHDLDLYDSYQIRHSDSCSGSSCELYATDIYWLGWAAQSQVPHQPCPV